MKFDMHCHTKEGSMDGKVMIEEYIKKLKEKGFGGMLVSDHNSYDGYREWRDSIKGKNHTDFVVLKGVEYDTIDCGHMLVIMPEGVKLKLLELRGLPAQILIMVVHKYGGIVGTGASIRRKIPQSDQNPGEKEVSRRTSEKSDGTVRLCGSFQCLRIRRSERKGQKTGKKVS